jgi:hypothetical protein
MRKSRRYLFRAKLALHVQQAEVVEWALEMTPDFLCVFFSHILRPPHINRMLAVAFYQTRKKVRQFRLMFCELMLNSPPKQFTILIIGIDLHELSV